jgi:opacity protein-like surface antigen
MVDKRRTMSHHSNVRRSIVLAVLVTSFIGITAHRALAQGFISPSFGYNFNGDAGCRTALDCKDKNWNFGVAFGALGPVVGFEAEVAYDGEFTGERPDESTSVLTVMGSIMLAPKISIVQPYGQAGIGLIKTDIESPVTSASETQNQIGWTVGGGLIVYVQKHVGLRGDIRYYHSFQALKLLDVDLARDENKIDFGRAAFSVVLKF